MTILNPEINQKITSVGSTGSLDLGFVNRRQHVRIYYPPDCPAKFLPELIIHYRGYQVLDISEGGIRFFIPRANMIRDGAIAGAIRFTDNTYVEIEGEVVRRTHNQIALKLEKGIPYSRILSEQVRLRNLESNGLISYVDK